MSGFSASEKALASILSNLPWLKNWLKLAYQIFNFFITKKKHKYLTSLDISKVDTSFRESFLGYYDKSPENKSGEYIVFHRSNKKTSKKPDSISPVDIILKNNLTNSFEVIGSSYSYNWQQGARIQWLTDSKLIYNVYNDKKNSYNSVIYNLVNKDKTHLDFPVYDCFHEEFALTLNFNRLMDLVADYGYRNFSETIDYVSYDNDGVFKVDISSNTSRLIISLKTLIDLKPLESMNNAKHKVNHIMISPDGQNFIFTHRWFSPLGKRFDRLLVTDSDGYTIKVIADEGMVSHCCLQDNIYVVGYLRGKSHGNSFYRINIQTLEIKLVSEKLLNLGDGHPTFNKEFMIFDSYPDRSRMKKLFLYNSKTDELNEMGEFFEPLTYFNETRCDLHPRWNDDGSKVFIDSVHEGSRNLYELKLK